MLDVGESAIRINLEQPEPLRRPGQALIHKVTNLDQILAGDISNLVALNKLKEIEAEDAEYTEVSRERNGDHQSSQSREIQDIQVLESKLRAEAQSHLQDPA